jgi:hypothetical protein
MVTDFFRFTFLYLTFSACSQHVDKGNTSNIKTHHAFIQTNVSGKNAEVSKLQTQVLALHDEAMLVLDDIMELRHKEKNQTRYTGHFTCPYPKYSYSR